MWSICEKRAEEEFGRIRGVAELWDSQVESLRQQLSIWFWRPLVQKYGFG